MLPSKCQAPDLFLSCLKACVLYIMRVGIMDQMSEPTQRGFLVFLAKQVCYMVQPEV